MAKFLKKNKIKNLKKNSFKEKINNRISSNKKRSCFFMTRKSRFKKKEKKINTQNYTPKYTSIYSRVKSLKFSENKRFQSLKKQNKNKGKINDIYENQ